MGGLMNRSSSHRDEIKTKRKKEKRKQRHQQDDLPYEQDGFVLPEGNENEDPNIHLMKAYDLWDNKLDQKPMMNMNDPPGAPLTYSPDYPMTPTDMMFQAWTSHHDANNSFYPPNALREVSSYNIPFDPNQHMHAHVPNTIVNHPPIVSQEERTVKKVQFASSRPQQQQQQKLPSKNLIGTQSWHELSTVSSQKPLEISTQSVRLSGRSSAPRLSAKTHNSSSKETSAPQPIYVSIDHRATLAGRGETIANKRLHQNAERNHADGLNPSTHHHSSHPRTNEPRKHRKTTDSPRSDIGIIPSHSSDSLPPRVSSLRETHTKSRTINKLGHSADQIPFIHHDSKLMKPDSNRRQQQSSTSNEIRPIRNRDIPRPQSRQHQKRLPNGSPSFLPAEPSKRRLEHKHSNSPVMRIPLSTHHSNQHHILSKSASTAGMSRIRT